MKFGTICQPQPLDLAVFMLNLGRFTDEQRQVGLQLHFALCGCAV